MTPKLEDIRAWLTGIPVRGMPDRDKVWPGARPLKGGRAKITGVEKITGFEKKLPFHSFKLSEDGTDAMFMGGELDHRLVSDVITDTEGPSRCYALLKEIMGALHAGHKECASLADVLGYQLSKIDRVRF